MPPVQVRSQRVAVIGGGAAGLVAARELRREGHKVVVFERGAQIGGTWVYTSQVESDLLGLDPSRTIVHCSLYDSLRVNLPREVMGFRDFPFIRTDGAQRDSRRFPSHQEVLSYLEDFASAFRLNELVRFKTEVCHVGFEEDGKKWKVISRCTDTDGGNDLDETYDAVVICTGHFTEPGIAEIPGVKKWPGRQIHSHNYRTPEPYRDQVVVLVGGSTSAFDISRDIAAIAKEVHIASRSTPEEEFGRQPGYDNMWLHPMIASAHEDGTIAFQDGTMVLADVILHCTGYKYHFPFLQTNGVVTIDDNRVGPLYKHVFPPALAPSLSFVGLPRKVFPFLLNEFQSKWIAGVLSGQIKLPSQEKMMEDVEAFYSSLDATGIAKKYTHIIGDYQFEYLDWLARECGWPPFEEWREQMLYAVLKKRKSDPETFRDEWEDDHLILQSQEDFVKYLSVDDSCPTPRHSIG